MQKRSVGQWPTMLKLIKRKKNKKKLRVLKRRTCFDQILASLCVITKHYRINYFLSLWLMSSLFFLINHLIRFLSLHIFAFLKSIFVIWKYIKKGKSSLLAYWLHERGERPGIGWLGLWNQNAKNTTRTPFFIGRTHFCTRNLGIW